MIADDVIQKVRERADITEIVGELVALKRAGASLKGLCPFHGEKTPSFVVNPQQGTYHCFGCQAHGDSLNFIKETQNLNFPEAVKALASRVGVEVPEERFIKPEVRERRAKRLALEDRLFDVQERLTLLYERSLSRSSVGKSYLAKRQISEESVAAFRLGWAGDDVGSFARWIREQEIALEDLITLGVVVPHDPDRPDRRGDTRLNGGRLRFRNRVMCPIFDLRDRVVGYSGRVVNPEQKIAKYLNSPETPLFVKSEHLFGLKTARVAMRSTAVDDLILCEGNLDVVSLWQAGFPNVVAAMGTALSERQALLIKRLSRSVTCVMDGDQAGQRAAFKSLPVLLAQGLNVRGKPLPPEQDPDSFVRSYGAKSFEEWLSDAQPLLLVRLNTLLTEHPSDPIGQAQVVREMIPLIHLIQDEHQRPLFLDLISKRVGVERSYLSDLMIRASQESRDHYAVKSDSSHSDSSHSASSHSASSHSASSHSASSHSASSHSASSHSASPGRESNDRFQGLMGAPRSGEPHGVYREPTHEGKRRRRSGKSSHQRSDQEARPWWSNVQIQRGGARVKPRVFGDRPTGEADIEIAPSPQPPASLASPSVHLGLVALPGYEREAISTLFYMPELLNRFLERGAANYFSHTGVGEFLISIKRERDEGRFATGESFLKSSPDRSLIATLKDCIAHPPLQNEKIDPERSLEDLIRRLRRGQLQLKLQEIVNELKSLSAEPNGVGDDSALSPQERREHLLQSYQEVQASLQRLTHTHQPS